MTSTNALSPMARYVMALICRYTMSEARDPVLVTAEDFTGDRRAHLRQMAKVHGLKSLGARETCSEAP